ncbi:Receptor like protein [Thalictrum thalictroides]|uniref:Receptor like protein n=1 Tax=Thalictrum thalictroides TaxID=46969 RepID=A0A7J6V0B3_THATH|nr:Receptor like protein [Thalictrum thalictroides]
MVYIDFSSNFLSGFDQPPVVLPWVNLNRFKIDSNMLHGSLPIPPPSIVAYEIQNNLLTGNISPMFCSSISLQVLDVSNNSLSGMLPQCLGNFSDNLRLLLLGSNSFLGLLPQTYTNRSNLRVIDVSQNKMQGKIPRSLENCLMLELLLFSNNNFSDVFPFWLGNLPQLKILAMRYNGFHGVIGKPDNGNLGFPDLRILDLSYNNFTGEILFDHVFSNASMIMRPNITVGQSTYMTTGLLIHVVNTLWVVYNKDYSLTIANKGVERFFSKIQEAFAAIDLSSNKFEGRIDPLVERLKGLRSFNISHNQIIGSIPSSFGSLPLLESLDISDNKLSGYIPQQLAQLTFLSQFNVSHNNLTGSIPQGSQLSTFNITSYEGNPGLCGAPLLIKCGNPKAHLPPISNGEEDDDKNGLVSGLDWIFVVSGFVGGSVVGVVLSNIFVTRRRAWLIKIAVKVGLMKQRREIGRGTNRVR